MLRPPRLTDVPRLFEFLGDREATRFTHTDLSLRQCRRRIAVHEYRRRRDGCAPWVVMTKEDRRIIGWGGIYDDPFDPGWGLELGYYLHPSVWGRGYATEFASACMVEADSVLRLPALQGFAHPENTASRRVLARAGFRIVRYVPELERDLFRRDRPVMTA